MKVELNAREIELLLYLMNEHASEGSKKGLSDSFSVETLILIDKLEAGLKKENVTGEMLIDTNADSLYH
ncbi:MAG: hypothetical protein JW803_05265 [Endomicrobiales bacterium]|nr:hypothetical protein [Endomicrobiales bacterium]